MAQDVGSYQTYALQNSAWLPSVLKNVLRNDSQDIKTFELN